MITYEYFFFFFQTIWLIPNYIFFSHVHAVSFYNPIILPPHLPPGLPQYDESFLNRSKVTSKNQLVACPKYYLAANNEAEQDFNENVACAVQTITTQEDGFLSQDQRCMLVLSSAMLIGAPVDHGHQLILVSLSNLYVETKQIKNGMDYHNQATEESQAIDLRLQTSDLRLDSKIAESCLCEVNKGIQNTKQLKNGMDNNNLAATIKESQASDLRLDSNLAESCSFESEGSQKAAAHFSSVVPVVSK